MSENSVYIAPFKITETQQGCTHRYLLSDGRGCDILTNGKSSTKWTAYRLNSAPGAQKYCLIRAWSSRISDQPIQQTIPVKDDEIVVATKRSSFPFHAGKVAFIHAEDGKDVGSCTMYTDLDVTIDSKNSGLSFAPNPKSLSDATPERVQYTD